MKLRFKKQPYQTHAVQAVVDVFSGQPRQEGICHRTTVQPEGDGQWFEAEFGNAPLVLDSLSLLENIRSVQRRQNLPQSPALVESEAAPVNLDIEMETGTGKTYCYIKTIHELYRRFGWGKFIIVVPSIAIREGVYKSFEITADHFMEEYGRRIKFFIYNSRQLHKIESFSSGGGINVMIINVQAFNARGKDNRRIYEALDDFQSRRPIDVLRANRPVLILDEPQKMEGDGSKKSQTFDSIQEFGALCILRYSATHKKMHNRVYRLDALDAYNQKLVKKIAVRGISVKGLSGTHGYLYLESIEVSSRAPVARIEMEVRQKNGIRRVVRRIVKGDNLYKLSSELDEYKGYVVSEIDALRDTVFFTNGLELSAGEAAGNVDETTLRRIQIREAIQSHFEKEKLLYPRGIKVLTLFFIDQVAKYRVYGETGEESGEYARIFEEEYQAYLGQPELELRPAYAAYLKKISATATHNGYFSIDKKNRRMVDPVTGTRSTEADDVDAYDLILKDKERLLSFEEPTRFIFSHSALREGWDNPNVFVICTLKHSDNTISRRQEVGRGLRIAVDQYGERQDDPQTVHQTNVLTVVASESYSDFVAALQRDISESLSGRPRVADEDYFLGKMINADEGFFAISPEMARHIYKYLLKNEYVDDNDALSKEYYSARECGLLAVLPDDLSPYKEQLFRLIDDLYSESCQTLAENERGLKTNPLNDNFSKQEFKKLWNRISRKAVYCVRFESRELIRKCVKELDTHLRVSSLLYTVEAGEQEKNISFDQLQSGRSFEVKTTKPQFLKSVAVSSVRYDLVGKIAVGTALTRKTVQAVLGGIQKVVFRQFCDNPEQFISEAIRMINEQKATVIIEHLTYDMLTDTHDTNIFTEAQAGQDFSRAGKKLKRHIYDYLVTDSKTERRFAEALDTSDDVVVYAKLPRGFAIPTPVGSYNPDWAIAFKEGAVKHIYFIAETKGTMSSLELRGMEQAKIDCARRFFESMNQAVDREQVRYDVVDNYATLLELVSK